MEHTSQVFQLLGQNFNSGRVVLVAGRSGRELLTLLETELWSSTQFQVHMYATFIDKSDPRV